MSERGPDVEVGKRLFGREARLRLGIYLVTKDGPAYLSEISTDLGFPLSAVAQELRNFVDLGMLQRVNIESSRRVYYSRLNSPWWSVFAAAAEVVLAIKSHETIEARTSGG